jgi:hypothetical protein
MNTVPERRAIDRTKPPYKDDPLIAALTDEQVWQIAEVMAALARSFARKLDAVGITDDDLRAGMTGDQIHAALHPAATRATPVEPLSSSRIVERDGLICHLCLQTVDAADISIDHMIPRSKAGPEQYENLAVAHLRCNRRKGNRLIPSLRYPNGAPRPDGES